MFFCLLVKFYTELCVYVDICFCLNEDDLMCLVALTYFLFVKVL